MLEKQKLSPIIVALDYSDPEQAIYFSKKISPMQCQLKIGQELFINSGAFLIHYLHKKGFKIFLDLKFYDIPNTVKKSVYAVTKLDIWMLSLHIVGGKSMMLSARSALSCYKNHIPKIIGVTILTSMNKLELRRIGIFTSSMLSYVKKLSIFAKKCKLDGIVCSPWEAKSIRKLFGKNFIIVTPGIRPKTTKYYDQKRVMTPKKAIKSGADFLVIGRPITQSDRPDVMLKRILSEIN
ncbi:MAG: orotidine-5'-phosphate decarboxylase [Wigglesworthia glossinidia]|nr:orotidine-5'-phosphate decarboxylase [Wigglesworthia glossinidia]